MNPQLLLLFIGAYVLGSIPFGFLIAKARGVDITRVGSGNTGATNVHRALGWKAGLVVLLLDVAKGLVPPLIAKAMGLTSEIACLSGIAAVLGHCFSPFLRFKGGKGIATMLGAALGATPLAAAIGLAAFILVISATRYVSLASLAAVVAAVIAAFSLKTGPVISAAYVAIALFIVYKHRANIGRLIKGEEPKSSLKGGEKRGEAHPPAETPLEQEQDAESEAEEEIPGGVP